MYIISNVNEFGKRQYTDVWDIKDIKDVLIGITNDEEFSKVMYRDACQLHFDQVLHAFYPLDFYHKIILYGSERLAEAEISKHLILIFCVSDSEYEIIKKGRR